jgi:WD40 repeat protein
METQKLNYFNCVFSWINCFEVDTKNEWLLSGGQDWSIKVWNLKTFKCIKTMKNHVDGVKCLKVLPKNILASGSCDKNILLWNLLDGKCLQVLTGHDGWVRFCFLYIKSGNRFIYFFGKVKHKQSFKLLRVVLILIDIRLRGNIQFCTAKVFGCTLLPYLTSSLFSLLKWLSFLEPKLSIHKPFFVTVLNSVYLEIL